MASSSLLPLGLQPPVPAGSLCLRPSVKSLRRLSIPAHASLSSSSSSSSAWEREEQRWQREEQRWLREEQRWLREEARWAAEREALLLELAALRTRLEGGLPREAPVAALAAEAEVKEMVLVGEEEEVKAEVNVNTSESERKRKRSALKRGSEGEDVKVMQQALQRLGFYSGEEDMEYSSFSSGTERAVKTWQASVGVTEDGIMTTELLERLLTREGIKDVRPEVIAEEDGSNGAPVASVTEITDFQQTIIKESGDSEIEVSQRRVFLLGENRWEEPSRLRGRDNPISRSKGVSTSKCISCRGEGRLMCTECDGTGEPNIEPQFLEWIDEGAKCPYCEGLGYTICDVCEGKTTVQN